MGIEISTEEIMKDILDEVMTKVTEKKRLAEQEGKKFIEDRELLEQLFSD